MKAANILLQRYLKSSHPENDKGENFFTESHLNEALRVVGLCRFSHNEFKSLLNLSPRIWWSKTMAGENIHAPDLLLVYGPIRSHLGFPAWRLRYTEIVYSFFFFFAYIFTIDLNFIIKFLFCWYFLLTGIWDLWSIWDMVPFWRRFTSSQGYAKTMVSLSSPTFIYPRTHTHTYIYRERDREGERLATEDQFTVLTLEFLPLSWRVAPFCLLNLYLCLGLSSH